MHARICLLEYYVARLIRNQLSVSKLPSVNAPIAVQGEFRSIVIGAIMCSRNYISCLFYFCENKTLRCIF